MNSKTKSKLGLLIFLLSNLALNLITNFILDMLLASTK